MIRAPYVGVVVVRLGSGEGWVTYMNYRAAHRPPIQTGRVVTALAGNHQALTMVSGPETRVVCL